MSHKHFIRQVIPPDPGHIGWIAPLSICVLLFIGNGGYGTLIWVVTAELLPAKVRSVANSVIIGFAIVLGFLMAKTFADLLEGIGGSGTFWLYGSVCALGALFTAVFVPETRGRSIEEIQKFFRRVERRSTDLPLDNADT